MTRDQGKEKIVFRTDKGRTAFSIFRSFFWEQAKNELARLQQSNDPEDEGRRDALDRTLADRSQISFLVLLSLIPFEKAAGFRQLRDSALGSLPTLGSEIEKGLKSQFGYELAN